MIENKLLKRQLKKAKITNIDNINPDSFKKLLEFVELAYDEMDNNSYRLERTLEVSMSELKELNETLENKIKEEVENNRKKDEKIFNQARAASMGEMIANIAHQWRQPLSAISTTVTSMQLQLELHIASEEEVMDSFQHILEYTKFLSQTIDDFRGFLKTNEEKEVFQVSDVIDKTINIVKSVYIHNKIKIIYEKPSKQFKSFGMPNSLAQVLLNIFNNSKDAFINNDIEDKKVFINLEVINEDIVITITDVANGIDEEILDKIFDPYFTTKHQAQGTGIGLHMCNNIIEKIFKGTISAYNTEINYEGNSYKGACFKITLPRITKEDPSYVI